MHLLNLFCLLGNFLKTMNKNASMTLYYISLGILMGPFPNLERQGKNRVKGGLLCYRKCFLCLKTERKTKLTTTNLFKKRRRKFINSNE